MASVKFTCNMDQELHRRAKIRSAETGETMGLMIERALRKELGTSNGTGAAGHSTPAGQRLKAKKGKR